MSCNNCRNIEIKAKIKDDVEFKERYEIARKLTGEIEPKILIQRDVFFKSKSGRLKLRYEEGSIAKLIHYNRDNILGPKLSTFDILEFADGNLLERILSNSIGILGFLEKKRYLFIYDRTRIHLDIVKNNDMDFYGMEFEVKIDAHEDTEIGNRVAVDLMEKFSIKKEQLLEESYFEILNQFVN